MQIQFDNSYARLPERFYARQTPTPVPRPELIRLNAELATTLGIDAMWLRSDDGVAMLAGNTTPDGADPLAQAYAGHQFGGFVPQLGDGRALLLGEVVDVAGDRRDVQLKGAGRTPFSRGGDGKSALGPVIREYVVSEAMAALGVPTTRALAAVATGEQVMRQQGPEPGGVFTRVAASHIRVGTFQYFIARQDHEATRTLADHAIARHYPDAADSSAPYQTLLERVVAAQAGLIAHWLSLGFIHGVMNTDNTTVSGETIDYGPCAFMDEFQARKVFSSIDTGGRYAWGKQPEIGLWNLTRFAETLLPLLAEVEAEAISTAEQVLQGYAGRFSTEFGRRFRAKLGLADEVDGERIQACLDLLERQRVDFTVFFRRLTEVAGGGDVEPLCALFEDRAAFTDWFDTWRADTEQGVGLDGMRKANPVRIARNHRVEEAIQGAYRGEYAAFHRLVEALASPFDDDETYADLELPPQPAEVVHQTFCGT